MHNPKEILEDIRKNGGYLCGIYYPPEEEPLSDEEIQKTIDSFCKYNKDMNSVSI